MNFEANPQRKCRFFSAFRIFREMNNVKKFRFMKLVGLSTWSWIFHATISIFFSIYLFQHWDRLVYFIIWICIEKNWTCDITTTGKKVFLYIHNPTKYLGSGEKTDICNLC